MGEGFELEDKGAQRLRGLADPLPTYQVISERLVQSRFEARGQAVQPLVGRDQELALILERWNQVKSGEGQVVLLVGEAGIGKSRIVHGVLGNEP